MDRLGKSCWKTSTHYISSRHNCSIMFFRTHESFDAPTFVGYLKEAQRNFGEVAVVMNRASPRRTKLHRRV